MKPHIPSLVPLIALAALAAPVCRAAVVFADDFSEADGTAIVTKLPDVGQAWTGSGPNIVGGTYDSSGAGRATYGKFTTVLGAGQALTMTYDVLPVGGNNFFSGGGGYAGVSLYVAGSEQAFTGDLGNNTFWGVDQAAVGGGHVSTDATLPATATFNYNYDSGAWSFTTTSGVNLSGIGAAGKAFDEVRIANGQGGDIHLDNLSISINAVPETSSLALLGLGGFAFLRRRR